MKKVVRMHKILATIAFIFLALGAGACTNQKSAGPLPTVNSVNPNAADETPIVDSSVGPVRAPLSGFAADASSTPPVISYSGTSN
jgi:hypothetical protein